MGLFGLPDSIVGGAVGFLAGGPIGGLIGAGIGGGIDSNAAAAANQDSANAFSAGMSDTSYQRGMADMEAAGLNPILAAKVGGASTPTGVAAPVQNPYAGAASTAISAATADANIQQTRGQTSLIPAQAQLIQKQSDAADASAKAATANAASTLATMPVKNVEGKVGTALSNLMDTFKPTGSSAVEVLRSGQMPDFSFRPNSQVIQKPVPANRSGGW